MKFCSAFLTVYVILLNVAFPTMAHIPEHGILAVIGWLLICFLSGGCCGILLRIAWN